VTDTGNKTKKSEIVEAALFSLTLTVGDMTLI